MTYEQQDLDKGLAAIESRDYPTAFTILTDIAALGNAKAQCNLANLYHFGCGTDPSGTKAAELYLAVARLNISEEHLSALAYHSLSVLYIAGAPDLLPDAEKAAEYSELARASGWDM
jgi:TPR repeat protein